MNILDIGIDIVEIDRIAMASKKNEGFLKRIFTENEIALFKSNGYKPHSIAGNFAAKEAISKALGTGIRGYNFKDIEVLRNEVGKPIVKTYNNLNKICIDYNVLEIKVSISHCKEYAVANAMVIINN
ncbi:holo-ACP synthase [Metaclostridioides mangenotii]|uniref:Holo-[acyl-carrier-protein] synthase n=1 Tax=Metaclostridioides mangenotii TaxID=1540 RepID=A0ABS4EEF3_9FIRM|nr:holo-ACP synthase [Clostridioides mangenotii]MBP1856316.1 holo-[acyl-carrier protein] synthase [Clostridioides mangenotii]